MTPVTVPGLYGQRQDGRSYVKRKRKNKGTGPSADFVKRLEDPSDQNVRKKKPPKKRIHISAQQSSVRRLVPSICALLNV